VGLLWTVELLYSSWHRRSLNNIVIWFLGDMYDVWYHIWIQDKNLWWWDPRLWKCSGCQSFPATEEILSIVLELGQLRSPWFPDATILPQEACQFLSLLTLFYENWHHRWVPGRFREELGRLRYSKVLGHRTHQWTVPQVRTVWESPHVW